jgi:hypothetical protein
MFTVSGRRVLLGGLLATALATAYWAAAARREPNRPPAGDRGLERSAGGAVQAQMRNVDYRVIPGAVLNIQRLRGELHSKISGRPPVFDDKESFFLKIHSAEIGMTEQSMAGLFNEHVFAYPGSPLEKIEVHIEPDGVTQKGILRKALKIPFSIVGTVALTPEGEIRVHPTKIRVAGISVRGLLETFGLELDRLMKLRQDRGVRIDGNDFLISADRMLPPPEIRGKVTGVRLERGRIVLTFDSPGEKPKPPLVPPDRSSPNYMYYEGGVLAFGKLTMRDTELEIVDADPHDPFDFFLDHYNEQLSAGYDENLPDHGLLVHMPDYGKLDKPGAGRDKPRIANLAPPSRS